MKRIRKGVMLLLLVMLFLAGCSETNSLQDGYYTAQALAYNYGWKEYITIMVKGGSIVSVEYNAENASGFIKSWDNVYMNNMKSVAGTYPNEYTRYYAAQLTGQSTLPEIDTLSGASSSGGNFKKLAQSVVEQAIKGDSTIATVPSDPDAHGEK